MGIMEDKDLYIDTEGIDETVADYHHNRYEPTSYKVLDCIIEEEIIDSNSVLLDCGSGKGRVPIYMSYKTNCRSIGLEYDYDLYQCALKNNELNTVSFIHRDACDYKINSDINVFYFFNPFSFQIFIKVLHNILDSYFTNNRDLYLIFYYPSDEVIQHLYTVDELILYEVIDTSFIFQTNDIREAVYIFKCDKILL